MSVEPATREDLETPKPAGRVTAKSLTASNNMRLQSLLEQISRFKTVEAPEGIKKKRAESALCTPGAMTINNHRRTARKNISTGCPIRG
jgi:hypothetical protein